MRAAAIICSFSTSLDDMPRKDQWDIGKVLRVLDAMPGKRYSIFEVTDNMTIARTMTRIVHEGYIETDDSPYPWTGYKLTDKGRSRL